MATVIRFGKFRFIGATAKQHMPIDGYTRSASYAVEENEISESDYKKADGKDTDTAAYQQALAKRRRTKPALTKKGPGTIPVSFDVTLMEALGVNPETTYNKLRAACESGNPQYLYRNGKLESKNKFFLTDVGQSNVMMNNKGKITSCTVSLTFKESPGTASKKKTKSDNKRKK